LSKFEQFEAERLDLRNDAEQRGPIREQAGEHGLAAFQLRHHRGKGGQGGSWGRLGEREARETGGVSGERCLALPCRH